MELQMNGYYVRLYPGITAVAFSKNPTCFDPALEATAMVLYLDWRDWQNYQGLLEAADARRAA